MLKFILRLYALNHWLSSRHKNIATKRVRVGIFALVGSFLFHVPFASAESTTSGSILAVDSILQMFASLAFSIAAAITQWIVLIIDAMIPIMTFNNFVGNPVVKAGWAIVRDTVNMFFVVILIIIAFGTIFGAERFKWQQQVPRLLIMAIVVNFSKTLCGIMIDFGQVIMLTFANALREIAAGNFIQLLGLNQIYNVSNSSSVITSIQEEGGGGAGTSFDFFAAGVVSVVLVIWVLATLVILTAILLFRIIMLWVLVVIAPLAWFMKGAKGVIDSNAYEDWWKEFKCMVGIGPVLTFFLWLTLAVAGAGNIAANSGFSVDADSNNANFTSSLLELNNFLSFLIGMAMLFAGFKAAAQFCSSALGGDFVGKAVGAAKSGALQKSIAGLGIKAGSLGLRAGARVASKTPGALSAASRYVSPISLGTVGSKISTGIRGRAAGAAAWAGGDTFAGKYFRGKQLDIAHESKARSVEGIDSERTAMKDRSRAWKQERIEANLRNPPSTERGKEQMAALFEEVMSDGRLQKELLARDPDAMKKLWANQGASYADSVQGNASKMADLEGFKKKYAHITGSAGLLKDADDTKGLAADAWEDSAVQAKAGRIPTTFKKGDRALSALEAAREGFYGEDAQRAAIRGTKVERMDVGEQMEGHFESALQAGDQGSANAVIAQMQARYTDGATTEQERQKMARSMDRMRAAADKLGRDGNSTAADSLVAFDAARKGMEAKVGFGLPPAPAAGESADEYVDKHFGLSSGERIDAGIAQIDSEKTAAESALSSLDSEVQTLQGVEKQVADKQRQIAEVRKRIEDSVKQDRKQAYQPVRRGRKNLAVAQAKGDAGEIERAQNALREAEANFANVELEGNEEMKNSPDITSLETELQGIIEKAGGSARLEEVKEKSRRLRDLRAQADRLLETKARLERERAKRGT